MRSQELYVFTVLFVSGLAMIFWIVPSHTGDSLKTGLSPDTFPMALCITITALAGLQIIKGIKLGITRGGEQTISWKIVRHLVKYFGLLVLTFPAWHHLGFIVGSLFLLSVLLIATGERSPLPIAVASIIVVALVYCAITQALNVPLPG